MNGSIPWIISVFSGAALFALGGLLVFIGLILAPIIIHRADDALSVLLPENESLFKGLPVSFQRLSTYGRIIALRNVDWYRRNVFEGREDRSRAVEEAPKWLVRLCVWVFAGYIPLAVISMIWIGILKLFQ